MSGVDLEQRVQTVDLVELARQDGYEAFISGEDRAACKFSNGELRAAWEGGWDEARDYHDAWLVAP